MPDTLILGIGNIFRRDDGVGIRAIEQLRNVELPTGVDVIDWGNGVLGLLELLAGYRRILIVDAVQAGCQPGSIYRFVPDQAETERYPFTSLHELDALSTIELAQNLGFSPKDVVVFGVEPQSMEWGMGLTPAIEAVVPDVVKSILEEIRDT